MFALPEPAQLTQAVQSVLPFQPVRRLDIPKVLLDFSAGTGLSFGTRDKTFLPPPGTLPVAEDDDDEYQVVGEDFSFKAPGT